MSLLQMSFAGAMMIVAITVIRALVINLLPKKTFLVLWGIAVARLLLPLSVPSMFSVYSILSQHTLDGNVVTNPQIAELLPIKATGQISTAPSEANIISVWVIIWAAGVLVCTSIFAIAYWKCSQEFQTSMPVDNDFTKSWLNAHQLKRPISIRQSKRFSAPLTYGIFRPVILMPADTKWENIQSLKYVLTHEYVHIYRFDSIAKMVLIATLCIHWFNPLVWVMYILANRDIELSCDEAVIRCLGENTKAAYARTLISMEETRSGFVPLCNNFSKTAIEERIISIMKYKKASIFSLILALALIVCVTTAFATSANAQAQQAEPVKQDSETEIVSKPDSIPQIANNFGAYYKDNGKSAEIDTNDVLTATPVQSGDIYGMPIEKGGASANDLPVNNIIYFDTDAARDEHLRALENNVEKGLDRYTGFETMYADIDTSAPITYLVK